MLLVGAVGVALGVFLVFIGLTRRDAAVPADEYQFDYQAPSERAPQTPREVFRGATAVFERAIAGRQRGNKVAEDLARADLKLRPSEYFLIIAGSMAAFFLVSFAINRNLLVSIIFGAVGFFVPGFYVRYRQSRRMRALSNQLGDTILLLSNALKAGYSFAQAMATIAKSAPHPMSDEFSRAVREMNLGITVDDALEHMNQRIASDDFDLMVTAVEIHRVVGGNLAEILDTIAFTIRERIRIKGEIRVLTAQARASGYIITGLPFGVAGILTLISPTYITPLFWPPGLGWVFIAVGLIMMGTGGAIIRRITTIEV